MLLKSVVDGILKEKSRPMRWLAGEMGKTFDGLKLSLVNGSIKYNDILIMAKILDVPASVFFPEREKSSLEQKEPNFLGDLKPEDKSIRNELKNCREMLSTLKDQLKDKDKIISLLSK